MSLDDRQQAQVVCRHIRRESCHYVSMAAHQKLLEVPEHIAFAIICHPYQGVMVSYIGVPITEFFEGGEIVGSLCHFDVCSQFLDPAEFGLLQQVAKLIRPAMIRG
ncbi:GAF domain-containing protein [Variovorax boronicumulans]|uniref:GAF domain-containing protein n=1 Tax=Variovorax boronicumulans TaxID=436515 RepID=UPI001C55BD7F